MSRVFHGASRRGLRTAEYRAWLEMKKRCYRRSYPQFHDYGGRGIIVCEQWRNDFPAFLRDVGVRPSDKHSLDRIDVNGNYEPGNVRWTTLMVQQRNKRTVHVMTINGETKSRPEWAEIAGINQNTLISRLQRGMSPESALFTQIDKTRSH